MIDTGRERIDWSRAGALALCLGLGVVFWNNPVLRPLKLLVVMMHESGHAIATWIAGGSVKQLTIASNESGECLSMLPEGFFPKVFVYSAGYVGSAVAGAVLLGGTLRFGWRRWLLGTACFWLAVMGLFNAGDAFTRLFCLGTAVVLGAGAKFLPLSAVAAVNVFLAAFSALYSVFDLADLWDAKVRSMSDAALLANLTPIPAILWAALWTAASVGVLALVAWWSLQRKELAPAQAPIALPPKLDAPRPHPEPHE